MITHKKSKNLQHLVKNLSCKSSWEKTFFFFLDSASSFRLKLKVVLPLTSLKPNLNKEKELCKCHYGVSVFTPSIRCYVFITFSSHQFIPRYNEILIGSFFSQYLLLLTEIDIKIFFHNFLFITMHFLVM